MFYHFKQLVKAYLKKRFNLYSLNPANLLDRPKDVIAALKRSGLIVNSVMDVGAARGEWTRSCLTVYPDASCMMIEPLIENESVLKKVVEDFPKVKYWIGAVGEEEGDLEIYAHGDQSSILSSEWGGETRKVPIRTLDAFLEDGSVKKVDLVKIDVQGAELSVLRGASSLLSQCQAVQVEVGFRKVYQGSAAAHEVITWFGEHGFRIYDMCDVSKRDDRALLQCDIFFVKDGFLFFPESWRL